jgi:hypothetical protein
MCLRTIKNLIIILLPLILTGIGFGLYIVSLPPPAYYGVPTAEAWWLAIGMGIVFSPLVIFGMMYNTFGLAIVPYILYYIVIVKYRKKWL